MHKIHSHILVVLALVTSLTLATACKSGGEETKPADTKTDAAAPADTTAPAGETTPPPAATDTTSGLDGVYIFDTEPFLANLEKAEDPNLKNMPENVRQQMVDAFKSFKIEVKGSDATASFGNEVLKGTLSKLSEEDGAVKFLMTPLDEAEKNNTVNVIIKGDTLTIDPGKAEVDKMYFKKSA